MEKIVLAPGDLFKSYFMEKSRLQVHSLFCPKDNIKKKNGFLSAKREIFMIA